MKRPGQSHKVYLLLIVFFPVFINAQIQLDISSGIQVYDCLSLTIVNMSGQSELQLNQTAPSEFILNQNYPNPFNAGTTISYSLPRQTEVTLEIFDLLGQSIKMLMQKSQAAGRYQIK